MAKIKENGPTGGFMNPYGQTIPPGRMRRPEFSGRCPGLQQGEPPCRHGVWYSPRNPLNLCPYHWRTWFAEQPPPPPPEEP